MFEAYNDEEVADKLIQLACVLEVIIHTGLTAQWESFHLSNSGCLYNTQLSSDNQAGPGPMSQKFNVKK